MSAVTNKNIYENFRTINYITIHFFFSLYLYVLNVVYVSDQQTVETKLHSKSINVSLL